jgi:ribosomal protein L29
MNGGVEALSDDVEALKAALIVARAEAAAAGLNNPTTKR